MGTVTVTTRGPPIVKQPSGRGGCKSVAVIEGELPMLAVCGRAVGLGNGKARLPGFLKG